MTSGQPHSAGADSRPGGAADFHASPDVWAPRLSRVLDCQRDIYERLERLSLSQSQLISSDDTDELLSVLGQRQSLIEQLTELNEQMAPFTERWNELSDTLSDEQRKALRERFEDVSRLVASIMRRDEADRIALEARRGTVGQELQTLSRGKGAVAAYARSPGGGGAGERTEARFQDRRG